MNEDIGNDGPDVLRYRPHVILVRKIVSLSLLRHHVRDVDDGAGEIRQGFLHPTTEQSRDRAGKQAAWCEHEHVGDLYSLDHPSRRGNPRRLDGDLEYLFS